MTGAHHAAADATQVLPLVRVRLDELPFAAPAGLLLPPVRPVIHDELAAELAAVPSNTDAEETTSCSSSS